MLRIHTDAARLPAVAAGPVMGVLLMLSALVSVFWSQGLAARDLPDFSKLVEENSRAVVNISTVTEPESTGSRFHDTPFCGRQVGTVAPFSEGVFRRPPVPVGGQSSFPP